MHSHRRRSALTVSAAAAIVVAVPLLSACGNDAHPGAAAVVKGDRISVAELQSRVGAVRDAQRAAPQSEQMIKSSGQLTRATLDGMIRDLIVSKAAEESSVSVSRREVQEMRGALARQAGGEKQMKAMLLQQQAIAPGEINDRIRMQLAVEKIAKAEGIDPQSPQGSAQLNERFAKTSKTMAVDVNPRFGKWDTKKATLANAEDPWLRDLSGKQAEQAQQQM
ncbi:SurA N-terminal domain-containing protein [Streptomyces daliensis]|uniref:SurA N-terminal domain-containing protein n=1 Tax=Streptomyces daliensis TaxID=299421 RepID=A0A8T4IXQ3_9ACTN|nr:SurA N-terminal domain-containing protein [Streptomyces daliensis]